MLISHDKEMFNTLIPDPQLSDLNNGLVRLSKPDDTLNTYIDTANSSEVIINESVWLELLSVLNKYDISYNIKYERRDVQRAIEHQDDVYIDQRIILPNLILLDTENICLIDNGKE